MPGTHPPMRRSSGNRRSNWSGPVATPEELARWFEPAAQTIRNKLDQADRESGRRGDGSTGAEREELGRLKRENRRRRRERGFERLTRPHRGHGSLFDLARAAAWFARQTGSIPPGT